jgi:hypothetical protein
MNTGAVRTAGFSGRVFPTIDSFENGTLDIGAFDHEAHVYIAWKLLEEDSFSAATLRFTSALQRLTRALGAEGKYHETISWFYMALIAERRSRRQSSGWSAFSGANPDLLSAPSALLEKHYSQERLWSDLAKRQFLLPDRQQGA